MIVNVKLFAAARQATGHENVNVNVPDNATIADVRNQLAQDFAVLSPILPHCMMALDTDYAADNTPVHTTSVVACIPPVSGG